MITNYVVFDDCRDATYAHADDAYIFIDAGSAGDSIRASKPKKVINVSELLRAAVAAGIVDILADCSSKQVLK